MRFQRLLMPIVMILPLLVIDMSNSTAGSVDVNGTAIAIQGYDPVAYHTKGRPQEGYSNIMYKTKHMNWHFCSEENRRLFIEDKKKYMPAYNGYCSYCMYHYGAKKGADPHVWLMKDGRVFLFSNEQRKEEWEVDPENIKKGDENWKATRYQ